MTTSVLGRRELGSVIDRCGYYYLQGAFDLIPVLSRALSALDELILIRSLSAGLDSLKVLANYTLCKSDVLRMSC